MSTKVAKRVKRSSPARAVQKAKRPSRGNTKVAGNGVAASDQVAGFLRSLPKVDASRAREGMSELLGRVGFGGEHIAVARHGRIRAVLVSPEDYERFRVIEDLVDGVAAEKALQEFEASGEAPIPYTRIREDLGLGRRR